MFDDTAYRVFASEDGRSNVGPEVVNNPHALGLCAGQVVLGPTDHIPGSRT